MEDSNTKTKPKVNSFSAKFHYPNENENPYFIFVHEPCSLYTVGSQRKPQIISDSKLSESVGKKRYVKMSHTGGESIICAENLVYVLGVGLFIPEDVRIGSSISTVSGLERVTAISFYGEFESFVVLSKAIEIFTSEKSPKFFNGQSPDRKKPKPVNNL